MMRRMTGATQIKSRFTGGTIRAFMWPSWSTIQLKEGLGTKARVRHVEMHIESEDIGQTCCKGSETPVSWDRQQQ